MSMLREPQQVAMEWVAKSRREVREEERIKDVEKIFLEEFHFLPSVIDFEQGRAYAKAFVKFEKIVSIIGKVVKGVLFKVSETFLENDEEEDFRFGGYKFVKYRKKHKVEVEIIFEENDEDE